jgi:hypothetical protein
MAKRAEKLVGTDGTLWAFMKVFEIPDLDDPTQVYLKRWRIIQTPYFGIYLHKILLPDGDRNPHNHPWDFWSFILKGQYTEEFKIARGTHERPNTWRRGSFHKMWIHNFHRITLLEVPTWTLVFTGKRVQDWGFLDGLEFIPHAQYIKDHYPDGRV